VPFLTLHGPFLQSRECQRAHWRQHRPSCEEELSPTTYRARDFGFRYRRLIVNLATIGLGVETIRDQASPSAAWTELVRGKIYRIDLIQTSFTTDAGDLDYNSLALFSSGVVDLTSLEAYQPGIGADILSQLESHQGDAVPVALLTIGENSILLDLSAITFSFDIQTSFFPPGTDVASAELNLHWAIYLKHLRIQSRRP
jgi:hypothetical protein